MDKHTGRTLRTEDGYTFHELEDGRLVDNVDASARDLEFSSLAQLIDDYGCGFKWLVDPATVKPYALVWVKFGADDNAPGCMPCDIQHDARTGAFRIMPCDAFYSLHDEAHDGRPERFNLMHDYLRFAAQHIENPPVMFGPELWVFVQFVDTLQGGPYMPEYPKDAPF